MVIKILSGLAKRVDKLSENFNKWIVTIKKNQSWRITNLKKKLKGINSRLEDAKEWISDLEDGVMESNQTEQHKEKNIKWE